LIKSITIITGQHLVSNPRVWKEANILAESGYRVRIFTTWHTSQYLIDDRMLLDDSIDYKSSFSLIYSHLNFINILFAKATLKLANLIYFIFGLCSNYQLIYWPKKQLEAILNSSTDLFICHQEVGLLLGTKLLDKGYRVAFDFEDWYSEDYLDAKRPVDLLKKAEAKAIKYGLYVTTTSKALSSKLMLFYSSPKHIIPIYNTFPLSQVKLDKKLKIPSSVVWFSQSIGPGRGIESFLISLKELTTSLEIHLIGNCTRQYRQHLNKLIKNTPHKLSYHDLCQHDDLLLLLNQFDIGLALEQDYPLNRRYTITNKILTYLQLDMNVLASKTIGQLELKNDFKDKITFVDLNNTNEILQGLKYLLEKKGYSSEIDSFPEEYSWNFQKQKMLSLISERCSSIG
jgi:hypothetical protein